MSTKTDTKLMEVPLSDLHDSPYQPRETYDEEALGELTKSMKQHGWRSSAPANVRPRPAGGYELIGGHRRTRAAREAGLSTAWVIVTDASDEEARMLALLDNLQRDDFRPWEEGAAFSDLAAQGMSTADIAEAAGKSEAYVRGRIDIADGAGQKVRQAWEAGDLGTEALSQIATRLPREPVEALECPAQGCRVILPGDTKECPACGADTSRVLTLGATDLQAVAVKKAAGKPSWQVPDIVQAVLERYGLSGKPVQVSMGFNDAQIREEVLATKTDLERRLGKIGNLRDWALEHRETLEEYPPEARAAALSQLKAAQTALRQVADMLEGAALELSAE